MNVPVALVRKMREDYRDAGEMWELARAADMPGSEDEYARMWQGLFDGIELKVAEGFFFMTGYGMRLVKHEMR